VTLLKLALLAPPFGLAPDVPAEARAYPSTLAVRLVSPGTAAGLDPDSTRIVEL
jgi:hypothetical protein